MTEEEKKTKKKKKKKAKQHHGDKKKKKESKAHDEDVTEDRQDEENGNVETQQQDKEIAETHADLLEKVAPTSSSKEISSLNAYYGNFKGFLATVSLILNSGLMVYAHVGLSAVVLSSQPPIPAGSTSPTSPPLGGLCNENDLIIWRDQGGQVNRTLHSNFCSREYNGVGCLLDTACVEECFSSTFGYSQNCSTCFGAVPQCSFDTGCALPCASDSFSAECQECNIPCTDQLDVCLGFPTENSTDVGGRILQEGECVELNIEELDWFVVYELTFINSVEKAWNGNAKFLAIIIVVFSGIWPYAKNIILIWIWYWPLSVENRTTVLTWLLRLSKYTLVDVFAVISVLVGVLLELNVGGTEVATRAEPRPSIIAFFLATLWEICQIEWVLHCHNKHVRYVEPDQAKERDSAAMEEGAAPETENEHGSTSAGHLLDAMRFRSKLSSNENTLSVSNVTGMRAWVGFLLVSTLALYLAGSTTELVQFTSFGAGDTTGCKRSYNMVTFGNAMVSNLATSANSAVAGTWTLYVAYVILVLFLPISVHCMQLLLLALASFGDNKEKNRRVCRWAASLWGFSSVEVFLIGIFSVESNFERFVSALAGNDNSQFFFIKSSLGPAFFILIVYSLMSGLLQYFIFCATAEYYHVDPYHKVHVMWTKLFGCWLDKENKS